MSTLYTFDMPMASSFRVFAVIAVFLAIFYSASITLSAELTDLPPDLLSSEDLKKITAGCDFNPYPTLRERYKPGPQSAREGVNGINKLNGDFACRLPQVVPAQSPKILKNEFTFSRQAGIPFK